MPGSRRRPTSPPPTLSTPPSSATAAGTVPSSMAECRPDMEKRAEWPARGRAAVSPFPGDIVESSRVQSCDNLWWAGDDILFKLTHPWFHCNSIYTLVNYKMLLQWHYVCLTHNRLCPFRACAPVIAVNMLGSVSGNNKGEIPDRPYFSTFWTPCGYLLILRGFVVTFSRIECWLLLFVR